MNGKTQTLSTLKPFDLILTIILGIVAGVAVAGPILLLVVPYGLVSYLLSGFDKNIYGELIGFLILGAPVALLFTGVFVAVSFMFHAFILSKYQERFSARKWLWALFLVPLTIGVIYNAYSHFESFQAKNARNEQEVQREVARQNMYPVIAGSWHIERDGNSYTFTFTNERMPNPESKQRKLTIINNTTGASNNCSYVLGGGPPYGKYSVSALCPDQDAPLLGQRVGAWQTIREMSLEGNMLKFITGNYEPLIFTK